jgi:2-polyprenyl-6-methoxyphenol hydroxylase-like FAD-dependent oxidoreductase
MSNKVEVLIVGAGPVGLSAALGLAQAKVPIRIIDRLPTPTDQSRAAVLHVRTLERFGLYLCSRERVIDPTVV